MFVDARGLPLRYIAVKETFDRLVGSDRHRAGGAAPPASARSAAHVRGARAARRRPQIEADAGANMAALATYMGHVNIYATYWYLEATADLMRDVAAAGEAFFAEGRQS